jgi:hypothetical protein
LLQVFEETKVINLSTENNLYQTAPGIKRNYWINLDYSITPSITLKTRAQFNTYQLNGNNTQGMAILQDLTWQYRKLSISGRYALIDTDSYDNRVYVYEKDVWLAFTFPAYYGVGVRNYLLVQYAFTKDLDVWLRWGHDRFTDRDTIGSSGETVEGNSQNDLRFQVRIRF